jgi:hypothetical protein
MLHYFRKPVTIYRIKSEGSVLHVRAKSSSLTVIVGQLVNERNVSLLFSDNGYYDTSSVVLTVVIAQMALFWVVTSCVVFYLDIEVSDECAVSIFRINK